MQHHHHHGPAIPFPSFRRSILTIRNDHSSDDSDARDSDLESFQRQVNDRFNDLSSASPDEFLSAKWMLQLLDTFIGCQEDFRVVLCNNRARLSKPPLDRLITDFFEKSVKALDICNAGRDGIEKIRQWQKHSEIVLSALDSQKKVLSEGQFRRAKRALLDLSLVMLDDKEKGSPAFSHRNRSFGSQATGKEHHHRITSFQNRSLSCSVSRSWSASKQLQYIASSLTSPRGNEITATNGLAVPVYTMSCVLMFVLWALVAAIPCQDRNIQVHFSIPRQYSWSSPLLSLQDRILEEAKNPNRRHSSGLLKEILVIEKSVRRLTDLMDSVHFPIQTEQKEEVDRGRDELSSAFASCKDEMDHLEQEVRDVFRKIMSFRIEGLDLLNRASSTG